jgi:hypothetical protein
MKLTKKMITAMTFLTLGTSISHAQVMGGVGNGGGTHWCPNKAPEMYDVYEGIRRYKLNIIEDGSRSEEIIKKALLRVQNSNATLAFELNKKINFLLEGGLSLEDGIELRKVPDANVLMVDEGCEYRQLANWDNVTNRVFVNNDYYQSMSELNKAALILHEGIYSLSRDRLKVENSDSSRKLVAELLATPFHPSSLNHLNSALDVMTKDKEEGVTLLRTSDRIRRDGNFFQFMPLSLHVNDLNLVSLKSFGKLMVRVPQFIKDHKDLKEVNDSLNSNRLSRKERRDLEAKKREIETKIHLNKAAIRIDGKELIKGVYVVDLEKQNITFSGWSMTRGSEVIDLEFIFYLNDNTTTKTLRFNQNLEIPSYYNLRRLVLEYDFLFSQQLK